MSDAVGHSCVDARNHIPRENAVLWAELIIDAQRGLLLVLMHRSAELNEAARIVGLGQVRRDFNRRGTHCERSRETTQDRGGGRNGRGTRASGCNVLRKVSLQFGGGGNVCSAVHQILTNSGSLVSQ